MSFAENPQLLFKLWLESFRYCLTRQSYAVWEFCDYFKQYYAEIPLRAKCLICKELIEEIERGLAGDQCDKNQWLALFDFISEAESDRLKLIVQEHARQIGLEITEAKAKKIIKQAPHLFLFYESDRSGWSTMLSSFNLPAYPATH